MKKVEKMRSEIIRRMERWFVCTVVFILVCNEVWAAGDASSALTQLVSKIKPIFTVAVNVMYAIAAIAGIVGAVTLYQKWNSGDPNTGKLVGAWFGAAIFLGLAGVFLEQMFLK